MMNKLVKNLKEWQISLICFALALLLTAVVLLFIPNKQEIGSLWILLFKLVPYCFAALGIAYFPNNWFRAPWNTLLIMLSFAVMFCYFTPRLFFLFFKSDFENYYMLMQIYVPFIILSLSFAYRMGGGKIREAFVFATCTLLFMLSGIEDLAFILVNPHTSEKFSSIPDVWDWAHHMTVFVGRPLNKYEAFLFIGVHFLLIAVILYFAYWHKGFGQKKGKVRKETV